MVHALYLAKAQANAVRDKSSPTKTYIQVPIVPIQAISSNSRLYEVIGTHVAFVLVLQIDLNKGPGVCTYID